MSLIASLRDAARRRAAYRRTVWEIEGLSRSTAEDIGVFPADARRIAQQAVYG